MASGGLRDELKCSICLSVYEDPVSLPCDHNFCRTCIGRHLDTSDESGYSCPECREMFSNCPELRPNLKLKNIIEIYLQSSEDPTVTEMTVNIQHLKLLSRQEDSEEAGAGNVLQKLISKKQESDVILQRLRRTKRDIDSNVMAENITATFKGLKRQLKHLEEKSMKEIHRHKKQLSRQIKDLEIKNDELYSKIVQIEELRRTPGLRACIQEEDLQDEDERNPEDGNECWVLVMIHKALADLLTGAKRGLSVPEASDLFLDVSTASNIISISGDLKTATLLHERVDRPPTPQRFEWPQLITTRAFSSGQHYWEVEVSKTGWWGVGMSYPSVERGEHETLFGNDSKSWCIVALGNLYNAKHNIGINRVINVPRGVCRQRIGVYLDYDGGRLSFYELGDPIRHIHTFTASFSEPLHAAFVLGKIDGFGWIRIRS